MKSVDLNANWKIGSDGGICDMPHDALIGSARDYSCAFGELNGYFPAMRETFARELPTVGDGDASLVVSGACGYGDVYVNDRKIGSLRGYAPTVFDMTGLLGGARNTLRLDMTSSPEMSDKYVGLGIAGGVSLVTTDALDFVYGTLFVKTATAGDKTYADVTVTVKNRGNAVKFVLDCTASNSHGKRAGKKQRKIFMRADTEKTFTVRVRLNRAYEWTTSDPYMYTMTAKIICDGCESEAATRFGIVKRALNPVRGLYLNNKNVLLFGGYVSHADAVIGGVCNYSNDVRRLSALKAAGFNAVRFVGCPTEATLDALDDTGMYAYIDLFPCLCEGKAPLDGHIFFDGGEVAARQSVIALRNHPSVVMYGVADDVPECYGRHDGHALIARLADVIKETDDTRPVTVSVREQVPTARELEDAGIRRQHFDSDAAKINAGREKDLFDTLTAGAFDKTDVCGLNYLYPIYSTQNVKYGRLIVGSRTSSERAFESYDETEKNMRVIGDFCDCAIDYPGGGKLNQIATAFGDLDAICDPTPRSEYKRILLGERGVSCITVVDPDTEEAAPAWNWPRYLGQTVTVKVYTAGDVVALYLDDRLIGRKLAGKINKHTATFNTEYYPGKLTAISYFKGVECSRASLETASSPKLVKLSATEKNLRASRGDLGFVHIDVCDREGRLVRHAMRQLTATVTGGTLVGFTNADPLLRKPEPDVCPVYNGSALLAVKPDVDADRVIVKVSGDGLLAAKLTFKVKE